MPVALYSDGHFYLYLLLQTGQFCHLNLDKREVQHVSTPEQGVD